MYRKESRMKKLSPDQRIKIKDTNQYDLVTVFVAPYNGPDATHGLSVGTIYTGACIKAHYAESERAKLRESFASAPELTNDETVEIMGHKYRVKINGMKYNEPVTFIAL